MFEMSKKRGRPLSNGSDDARVDRRRELDRARQQRRRQRQREGSVVHDRMSTAQYEQAETVISLPTIVEEEVAVTLRSLGDPGEPQDLVDIQLQECAEDVDEHNSLYPGDHQHKEDSKVHRRTASVGFFQRFSVPKQRVVGPGSSHNTESLHGIEDGTTRLKTRPNVSELDSDRETFAISGQPSPGLDFDDTDVDPAIDNAARPGALVDRSDEIEDHEDGIDETEVPHDTTNLSLGREDLLGQDQLEIQSSSDESDISFASEHEVDEEKESASEYTAERLFQQLQGGHHGCSGEEHAEKLRQHMEKEGNNHYRLSEIFHDRRFPSALEREDFITPTQLEQQQLPNAREWKAMFCGVPVRGNQRLPTNICLHKEPTQANETKVVFDADSILGFWPHLAVSKSGLEYQPAPQTQQNIQTDVHLEMNAFSSYPGDDEVTWTSKKMLRDVPHCLLGRVSSAHNMTVHVLFPHLQIGGTKDRFVSMTEEQLARWTDEVFHPALWKVLPAHYTQHLPPTYRVALANSKANQVEARKVDSSSYQARQAIAYHLQSGYLHEIWEAVLETVNHTPGLADFREPQLFFTAKGTKLSFQNLSVRPTLLDVMESLESYLEAVLEMRHIDHDRLYVDLGKEICPDTSLLPSQRRPVGQEAQVYSWKRCCLEEFMQWMYDGQPPSIKSEGQRYYHQNMLYEASSLTSVTPKASQLRKGGLIYSQFYGSVKEVSDAAKCKPFDNDGLEEMALDPQLQRAARNVAGGRRREAQIVEWAYKASKRRTRAAIQDSKQRSFGIREEHRITWDLFQRLKGLLMVQDRSELEIIMTDCPPYAWPVRTSVYLDFLWRSADKFATGFEIVRARSRQDMVTWEQTKMMFALLRCLRFVMGGHRMERESAMWCSKRRLQAATHERKWYGLGFVNTLPRYKYCWWEPRVDWERLCFNNDVTNRMLFGNGVLRGQVLRRGTQVTAFFDMALALERGLEWVESNMSNEAIEDEVLSWMVHVCLQQFRIDVLNYV